MPNGATQPHGQRTIHFETGGPTAAEAVAALRSTPPTHLGDEPVNTIAAETETETDIDGSGSLVLHLDHATVSISATTESELVLTATSQREPMVDARQHVTRLLAACATLAADPERAKTTTALNRSTANNPDTDIDIDTVEPRAHELFQAAPTTLTRQQALDLTIRSIDLTTLAGDDTPGRVRALCAQALAPDPTDDQVGPTAAVCVYPPLVSLAVELTDRRDVAVASVAGAFPSGLSSLKVRLLDIDEALAAGADEIDVVINRAAFVSGHHDLVTAELTAMRERIGSKTMKVILETAELESPAAIRAAAALAIQAGADWIKTSTGKAKVGATPLAVLIMAQAIADHHRQTGTAIGLKISGGVRTSTQALGYLTIVETTLGTDWLSPTRIRFGASSLLTAVVADRAAIA